MKIAVVAPSPIPFVFGGAERFWLDLVRALNELTPHQVELLKVPTDERDFWSLVAGYRRFFTLRLDQFDLLISTKYPAWMVEHPRLLVYMQHKLRGLYDTYPPTIGLELPAETPPEIGKLLAGEPTPQAAADLFALLEAVAGSRFAEQVRELPNPFARAVVHFLDRVGLRPEKVHRYAAISRTVASRKEYFPEGVDVHVAPHPSGLQVPERPLPDAPVLFTASRLDGPKRIDLLIRAFRRVPLPEARLRIAGTGPMEGMLRRLAAGDGRIEWLGRLSDREMVQAYQGAVAVPFVPLQEDLGLIALEAMGGGRPVVTCTDSGGVVELVGEEGGLVVPPEEGALADAMVRLLTDRPLVERLSASASRRARRITWSGVFQTLGLTGSGSTRPSQSGISARSGPIASPPKRRGGLLLVLAPFSLRPPRGGGANRIFHLYRHLSRSFPVKIVTVGQVNRRYRFPPRLEIEEIAATPDFHAHVRSWEERLVLPAADIALLDGMDRIPLYRERTERALARADGVILSHPYAASALPDRLPAPLFYDAHNVELRLKRAMFEAAGSDPAAAQVAVELIRSVEARLVREAEAVFLVSEEERADFERLYGPARRFLPVPNGVDLDRRPPFSARPGSTSNGGSPSKLKWRSLSAPGMNRTSPPPAISSGSPTPCPKWSSCSRGRSVTIPRSPGGRGGTSSGWGRSPRRCWWRSSGALTSASTR